jgi:TRAP-type C4-dicarboxylate transport system permease small subunit
MLARFMNGLRLVERTFIALIMIGMSVLFFVNVAVRFTSPRLATELAWIEEATLFAFAWMVFIGLGLSLERRLHVAMTIFLDTRSPAVERAIQRLINLTGLAFCIFLTKTSFDLALFIYDSGQVSPTLGFSVVGLYAPLPIGFALLALRYLLELLGFQDRTRFRGLTAEVSRP